MVLTFSRLTCGELPSQRLRALTLGLAFGFASFGEWVSSFIAPVSEFSFLDSMSSLMKKDGADRTVLSEPRRPGVERQICLSMGTRMRPRSYLGVLLRSRSQG